MRRHDKRGRDSIPVLVAGTSGLVSRFVSQALRRVAGGKVGVYGEPARQAPPTAHPSIVVIDQGMVSGSMMAYLEHLRSQSPHSKFVIIGSEQSDESLMGYIAHGVRGFVRYEEAERDLGRAIETVWAGEMWIPPKILAGFGDYVSQLLKSKQGVRQTFTTRERMVLELVAQGRSNKELSGTLGISEATVKFHLKNIFAKLGIHERHEAARVAKQRRLLEDAYQQHSVGPQ